VAHFLSVLVLYKLGKLVWRDPKIPFVGDILHILSPAGLFLSAPVAESAFALLSFVGYYLFALGTVSDEPSGWDDVCKLAAGAVFGVSGIFRSNSLLNGTLFAVHAIRATSRLVVRPDFRACRTWLALGAGGLLVAAGVVVPQVVAYRLYCSAVAPSQQRPWCGKLVPSIYGFVQQHYWYVVI